MNVRAQKKISWFQRAIFSWYRRNARDLPWRRTTDPYAIVVSEIMLQQTQVDRVVSHFPRWLARFPTWEKLSRASQRSVVQQWSGMGYNRRALNLHKLAKVVVNKYGGQLPRTIEAWEQLPGIGPYTARALSAFVSNKPQATLDVNINRVLHRVFLGAELPQLHLVPRELLQLAERVYPKTRQNHQAWNHALMDFGALMCTARDPQCSRCPLAQRCKARPTLHRAIAAFYKTKTKSREPGASENGKFIPNRIFRGRIVEYLRTHMHVALAPLGSVIKKDYTEQDSMWLRRILQQLENEGMVMTQHSNKEKRFRLR